MKFFVSFYFLSLFSTIYGFLQPFNSNDMRMLKNKGVAVALADEYLSGQSVLPVKVAVIIVDHGSRKSEANNLLMEVAGKYKKLYNIEIVEAAHMELSEPTISTAFRKCIDQGAKKIICHPFFLSKGRHVQEDIPEMMRAAAAEHMDIHELEYSITEPLGLQEKILELIHLSITNEIDKKILKQT